MTACSRRDIERAALLALSARVESFCGQYAQEIGERGVVDTADLVNAILQEAAVLMIGGAMGYLRYVADCAADAAVKATVPQPRGASG